jgi:predicted GNAT family N-acyltransferase
MERDNLEDESIHRIIMNNQGEVLAVGRLEVIEERLGQIRFMAVSPLAQGQGLGQQIMRNLENHAISIGLEQVELNARELAVNFYSKQGYINLGFAYQLFNDINHYKMVKKL